MPGMIISKDPNQDTETLAEAILAWARGGAKLSKTHGETAFDKWMKGMHDGHKP